MKLMRYADAKEQVGYAAQGPDGLWYPVISSAGAELELGDTQANVETVLAPVQPTAIYCVAVNYRAHGVEFGSKPTEYPTIFMKAPSSVIGPGEKIQCPRGLRSDKVDYEGELAVVIGRTCKNVSVEQALDYVWGYTCANDVTARDWQKEKGGGQFCRGKTFDTFCPLGPFLVTPDEIQDPQALMVTTRVNKKVVQQASTGDMLFSVAEIISFLSGSNTLLPGTVILTGTPEGVGMGQNPPSFLKAGDRVVVDVSGIGVLDNRVMDEVI